MPPLDADDYNREESQRRADEGMGIALEADRNAEWRWAADEAFDQMPTGIEFTADDLCLKAGFLPAEGANRNNVVGAWFNGKARSKRIVWTGEVRKSTRAARHIGTQKVWRKL